MKRGRNKSDSWVWPFISRVVNHWAHVITFVGAFKSESQEDWSVQSGKYPSKRVATSLEGEKDEGLLLGLLLTLFWVRSNRWCVQMTFPSCWVLKKHWPTRPLACRRKSVFELLRICTRRCSTGHKETVNPGWIPGCSTWGSHFSRAYRWFDSQIWVISDHMDQRQLLKGRTSTLYCIHFIKRVMWQRTITPYGPGVRASWLNPMGCSRSSHQGVWITWGTI